VLLYRVNRRPLPDPTLGGGEQPESVMNHILEVLHFGRPEYTGTGNHQREWILGNRNILRDLTAFTGQIGWQGNDEQQTSRYVPETREWRDELGTAERAARAPFAFDSRTRVLGILKHPSFSELTVASVFQKMLRAGEQDREWPSTEWSVEPVLDERDFLDWLQSVDSVTHINLVAEMPNPDGLEEFGPVWAELEARKARLIKTEMVAANIEVGLQGLDEDDRVRGNLAMGRQGFGHVQAWGLLNGRDKYFDQRAKVVRESTDELGPSWRAAAEMVLETTRRTAAEALRPRPNARARRRKEA
jgi:hypothetical protein